MTGAQRAPRRDRGSPLRFAVVMVGDRLEAWQQKALRLLADDLAQPALVIRTPPAREDGQAWPRGRRSLRNLYVNRRLRRQGRARALVTLPPGYEDVPRCDVVPHVTQGRPSLDAGCLARIASAGCDFVLDLSSSGLCGVPPDVVPHGLWRFTSPERLAVTDADASWSDLFAVRLVCAASDAGSPAVLHEGCFRIVRHSLADTVDRALFGSAMWLRRTCADLAHRGRVGSTSPTTSGDDPTVITVPAIVRSVWRKATRVWAALWWQERWHVGVVDRPVADLYASARLGDVKWLRPMSPRYYIADPFGIPGDERIMVEAFDHLSRLGHITTIDLAASAASDPAQAVLGTGGHMSYPYLVEDGGGIYCIPETCDQRQVALYRALDFPRRWERVAVLLDDFAAVDSTVIRHADRWWLFCVNEDEGPETHLHVFHAPDLRGPWSAHLLNPVKTDVRSSRPAGMPFLIGDDLIRPAQDGSAGYGGGVVFNHVRTLTPHAYAEDPVTRLSPDPTDRYKHGIHTVSAWGTRTLIDGKMRRSSVYSILGHVRVRLAPRTASQPRPGALADRR
jgi:hypothetical protein